MTFLKRPSLILLFTIMRGAENLILILELISNYPTGRRNEKHLFTYDTLVIVWNSPPKSLKWLDKMMVDATNTLQKSPTNIQQPAGYGTKCVVIIFTNR